MNILQHAMKVGGFEIGTFSERDIKPGFTVTKVEWHGCMATERKEVDVGDVVKHDPHNGYPGVVVRWDKGGYQWEPLSHFRKVNDELEVWT